MAGAGNDGDGARVEAAHDVVPIEAQAAEKIGLSVAMRCFTVAS